MTTAGTGSGHTRRRTVEAVGKTKRFVQLFNVHKHCCCLSLSESLQTEMTSRQEARHDEHDVMNRDL